MADKTLAQMVTDGDTAALPLAYADLVEVQQGVNSKVGTVLNMVQGIQKKGVDVASAAVLVLGEGMLFHITGVTTITDIDFTDSFDGRTARLVFDGSLTLTHNAASLILPGGVNIQTIAGDSCTIVVESGDNVRVMQYERNSSQNTYPMNASIATQSPAASATTYITNSDCAIPDSHVRLRTRFVWHLMLAKTAAGTVAPSILVKIGTLGTTADATVLTFAFPGVGTAVADEADIWIDVVVTSVAQAATTIRGYMVINRRLGTTATGWLAVASTLNRVLGTPATFNGLTASLKAGLAITLGASYVVTVELVTVESDNV